MLINRIKSFLWRLSVAVGIFAIEWVVENITGLGLPLMVQGIIILAGGEITKILNSRHQLKKNTQPVEEYKSGT